ncbi:hypothetical protein [Anatilimnocola floriformis]|uniref:hypothetical protein n=1 Tax=Anatilimnocola floriformis TaxID=2948575 RepID=UPI0020C44837|nr:hypothetical protein [Anatilimnocola floriformis]
MLINESEVPADNWTLDQLGAYCVSRQPPRRRRPHSQPRRRNNKVIELPRRKAIAFAFIIRRIISPKVYDRFKRKTYYQQKPSLNAVYRAKPGTRFAKPDTPAIVRMTTLESLVGNRTY